MQLEKEGVGDVSISVYRDATQLNQRLVATGRSDARGGIAIAIDEFGAGWMQEQWMIQAYRPGYEAIESLVTFPQAKENMRMLVILTEGWSPPPQEPEDLWEEYRKYR